MHPSVPEGRAPVRVIGRRKARNAAPAEEQPSPEQSGEPEPPEWRVIDPNPQAGPEAAEAGATSTSEDAPPAPFDATEPGGNQDRVKENGSEGGEGVGAPEGVAEAPDGDGDPFHTATGPGPDAGGGGSEATEEPTPDQPRPDGLLAPEAEAAQSVDALNEAPVAPPDLVEEPAAAESELMPDVAEPVGGPKVDPAPAALDEKQPKHASAEEDPISSVLHGPGPQGQRTLPRVMAVANQKGGVGKTTTTVNLGAALAELGYRVLVVDLDPQGNATTGLGVDGRNFEYSMYDVIMHETPMEDCIEPTSVRNLFVAPATIDLAGVEIELVPAFSRELRLRKAIERVVDDFDFVMIDCPPSLGLITVNGLAAAREVLVPIQCEYYALEGLSQLLRNVHLVASNLNESLEVSAIVLTMYDGRTRLAVDVAAEVREHFKDKVCRNVIPRTIRLSEAPSFGQPITVFDPTSRGAIAYRELAKEVSNGAPKRAG